MVGVTDRLQLFSESLALLAVLMLQSGLLTFSLTQSLVECVHLRLQLLHISLQLGHLTLPLSLTDIQLHSQLIPALLELLRTQSQHFNLRYHTQVIKTTRLNFILIVDPTAKHNYAQGICCVIFIFSSSIKINLQ